MSALPCTPQIDTDQFQHALESWRERTGDWRPFQELPRSTQSVILRALQEAKTEAQRRGQ